MFIQALICAASFGSVTRLSSTIDRANSLINKLKTTTLKLETMPHGGHIPPELERIGVLDFREVFYEPYRIIHQVIERNIYVHCILDGRRNLQDLLQQRVLR